MTTAEFFAQRSAELQAGVLHLLECGDPLTATQLRVHLGAGMRELDRVLQKMRQSGLIQSRRQRWERVF